MDTLSSFFFIPREGSDYASLFRRVRLMPLYSFPHFKDLNYRITKHTDRFFIHLDFDAFYAQVEQRDTPSLRGKPVSVGGTPDGKGIVMTASYEARALGIDTGMSVWQAKQICPELISLPCYGPKYEAIMDNLTSELKTFVPEECIEQYSIDECFLDISPVVKNFREAEELAKQIKLRIVQIEHLTASLGVSYNKTYAKIATKFNKPNGLTVINHNDTDKVYSLPVKKMWGIGTRIERRLGVYNINTVGDLALAPEGILKKEFGINGIVFRKLARGEDTSGIFRKKEHEKCLNHQHSLARNIYKPEDVKNEIRRVGEYICRKLRSKELVAGHLCLVIRYDNLRYAGDDIKLKRHTNDDGEIFEAAMKLYRGFPKPSADYKARMFGMSVFNLHTDYKRMNLELFDNNAKLPYYEMDKLKYKYGEGIIRVGIAS